MLSLLLRNIEYISFGTWPLPMHVLIIIFELFFAACIIALIYVLCGWLGKLWLRKGCKDRLYWLRAVIVILLPLIIFFMLIVWEGLNPTNRICGGWMSNSYPCGWTDYLKESLFWMSMLLTVPYPIWTITGCMAFYRTRRKWLKQENHLPLMIN